jgi:hypothetical protein
MPTERKHEPAGPDYLRRARLALRVLSGSGLGELTWVGPTWICALGDVDRDALRFLSMRIRQDSRLRRGVRQCASRSDLRRLQEVAISRALDEYAEATGRQFSSRAEGNSTMTSDSLATSDSRTR